MNPLLTPRRRPASDDNLIPLINIVFLLLIFFMVAGQMQRPMAADIRLPDIDSQQPAQGDIQLELTADGGLWLNQQATTSAQLSNLLAAYSPASRILLHADQHTTAAVLDPVLTAVRRSGFAQLQLVSEQAGH